MPEMMNNVHLSASSHSLNLARYVLTVMAESGEVRYFRSVSIVSMLWRNLLCIILNSYLKKEALRWPMEVMSMHAHPGLRATKEINRATLELR